MNLTNFITNKPIMTTADIIPITKLPRHHRQYFTYLVPKRLIGQIQNRSLVVIPLLSRRIKGVVINISEQGLSLVSEKKLKEVVQVLSAENALEKNQLEVAKWVANYYACSLSHVLKIMLEPVLYGATRMSNPIVSISHKNGEVSLENRTLWDCLETVSNAKTIKDILTWFNSHRVVLLRKTGQYIDQYELVKHFIDQNKQVLYLVPEISEAEILYQYYKSKFSHEKVVLLHSDLSSVMLARQLISIKTGVAQLVIGARMSVFAPFLNLGLIIIDEENSNYYKSWDQQPKYNARDIALKLGEIHNAKILLLADTPSAESYYSAQLGTYKLINAPIDSRMKQLSTVVISLTEEQKNRNYSLISRKLKSEIKFLLSRHKKVLLYLDRRGLYTFVNCRDCNHIFKCKNCNVSLRACQQSSNAANSDFDNDAVTNTAFVKVATSLSGVRQLICAYCDHVEDTPLICPKCEGTYIRFAGVGVKQVMHDIKASFPAAKVLEVDKETKARSKKASHINPESEFDIIIGTQAILGVGQIKDISLVAMLNIDISLNLPDFHSGEKTYALAQKLKTIALDKFIIQTYNHKNPIVQAVLADDDDKFFKKDLEDRKKFHYPPFSKIIKLEYKHTDKTKSDKESQKLYNQLMSFSQSKMIEISAPHPTIINKIKNKYSYQIVIKELAGMDINNRNKMFEMTGDKWMIDVDPIN